MRLLITGGAGFIGSTVVRRALADGHHVTVLDDLSTGYQSHLTDLPIRFVMGSLLDTAKIHDALEGVDKVIHLAALGSVPRSLSDPIRSHEANLTGTLRLLEAMRSSGVSTIVYSSSSSVYGLNPALPKDEREWIRPMSPYAVTKLGAEQYVLAYQQSFGFISTAFRFFNVYGPRQMPGHAYSAVIPVFLSALLQHKPLPVHGDGTQSRDFTYVDTVAETVLRAVMATDAQPEPINLAFGSETSLLQLIALMEEITGLEAIIEKHPNRRGDVPHSRASGDKIRKIFPTISPVPMREGLKATVAWLQESKAFERQADSETLPGFKPDKVASNITAN